MRATIAASVVAFLIVVGVLVGFWRVSRPIDDADAADPAPHLTKDPPESTSREPTRPPAEPVSPALEETENIPAAEPEQRQEPGRARFRVVDRLSGRPVTRFEVRWGAGRGSEWTRHASGDGTFLTQSSLEQISQVSVRAEGYEPGEAAVHFTLADIAPGEVVDAATIELDRWLALRGRVIDALNGMPLSGATVRQARGSVSPELLRMPVTGVLVSARTADDGSFEMDPIHTGQADYIAVWAEGYAVSFVFLGAVPVDDTLEVRLTHGGGFTGRLHDGGVPVEGLVASPKLYVARPGPVCTPYAGAFTGAFRLMFAPPGDYVVELFDSVEEVDWGRVMITVTDGVEGQGEWDIATFGGFSGRVLGDSTGVSAELIPADAPEHVLQQAQAAADGSFRLGFVPPGRYTIRVVSGGDEPRERTYTRNVRPGEWADITVQAP
ncbi:MAG: hypothetical protein GWP08_07130 [Nitrospiraceae bacterium]|nr:hypothetical protein [Nitrospiraceae bacterium]